MIQFLRRKINLSLFYLEVELSLGCKYKSNNLITGEPVMYWNFKQGLGFSVPDDKLK